MKILVVGQRYEFDNVEGKNSPGQVVQFVNKAPLSGTGQMYTVNDGTTPDELVAVWADRVKYLTESGAAAEAKAHIARAKEAVTALEKQPEHKDEHKKEEHKTEERRIVR